ncbi:hypothetical protein PF002_g24801 [Phytophthora fragariae]|uniref:RxLR effector protein n=1 Tax=Phytophthora fragariae TaxID=53985 RepID=A0A6A3WZV6_9STRA|nr:hypothetical protein PF003_g28478 [Phytophthora fragariae]KAE9077897.1 hypothetical protein PF007_g24073 [Phytophthora fragariae]KAE9190330.1 hypothetical protein PF002_g24801 [Phytophthora fragariae]
MESWLYAVLLSVPAVSCCSLGSPGCPSGVFLLTLAPRLAQDPPSPSWFSSTGVGLLYSE